jgi:hypothetical protein
MYSIDGFSSHAGRQIELVLGLALFHVEPLCQQRLPQFDHIQINVGHARRRADVDMQRFAALVDGLVQPQQHVLAEWLAVEGKRDHRRLALGVADLGRQVK